MLHDCAKIVVREYDGATPKTIEELRVLPGVGSYTAGAVMAFAWNGAVPIIETNIRSVYLHHFFEDNYEVTDAELMPIIERTLERKSPREWYYALMDYGAFIKKMYGNPNSRSKHHMRQSSFKGSDREIRGAIIRTLAGRPHTRNLLCKLLKQFSDIRIDAQVKALTEEGLIEKSGARYALKE